jgi:hypothetical protein
MTKYNQIIYYDKEGRGLRIGACWVFCKEENSICGWYAGYEGGGCYSDCLFKAIFNKETNTIENFLVSDGDIVGCDGCTWDADLVTGASGEDLETPVALIDDCKKCDDSRNFLCDKIEYDMENDSYNIPNKELSQMEEFDDGTHLLIDTEDGQPFLFNQVMERWQLLSYVTFGDLATLNGE